jgi:hypothetical protein
MAGSPLKRERKAGVVDPVTGELVPFPYLSHPRAGLSNAEWRALAPGEKIEHLLGMLLDRAHETLSWSPAELDPPHLSLWIQVWRVIFMVGTKALLDGKLGREAAGERDRQRALAELARDLRSDSRP